MNGIGKGLAVIAIMGACAYVGVRIGKPEEMLGGAVIGCVLLWIFG
jgi:hypothetical protein